MPDFMALAASGCVSLIPLGGKYGQGKHAIVDSEDAALVEGIGWSASTPSNRGPSYAVGRVRGKVTKLHRLIMAAPKGMIVSFRNSESFDCRRSNLRLCSALEHARTHRLRSDSSHNFKGIYQIGSGRYSAKLVVNRKQLHLGTFDGQAQAALAFDRAAREYHGDFARLNFPNGVAHDNR